MRQFIIGLTALILIGTSQASTTITEPIRIVTASSAKIATKKEQGLVKLPRIPVPKIFRSNPLRAAYYAANADDTDDIGIDDDDKITGYRKRDFGKLKTDPTPDDPEGIITEEIRWKLFLARQLALLKYREINT